MLNQIIAAGGLVTNPSGAILWIFRRGFWDLPKGKLDAGESIEACAVREVTEETGLHSVQLQDHLITTKHNYYDKYLNCEVTKLTYWYHMTIAEYQAGIPQITEDIERIEWNTLAHSVHCLSHTYENIKEVIHAFELKKG